MSDAPPSVPSPGWYEDPSGTGDQRLWDGQQWTDQTRPPSLSSNWRAWIARSPRATTISRSIVMVAGASAVGAFVIGLLALVRDRPLHGIGVLAVAAVPVVAVGQLWAIALINVRRPRPEGRWKERLRRNVDVPRSPSRTLFFGDLNVRVAGSLMALAALGWFSAMIAFPAIAQGGPGRPGEGCQYRLTSHGSYTCVSRRAYEHAGAGEQRFASGILLGFFAMHVGAALGGLTERKPSRD